MATLLTEIKSLQGRMMIASIDATTQRPYEWNLMGDVSDVTLNPTRTFEQFVESQTGFSFIECRYPTELAMTLNLTANHITADNLSIAFSGTKTTVTSGTVTAENLNNSAALVVGKHYVLAKAGSVITSLAITDSTAVTPIEMTAGTHFIQSSHGSIEILAIPAGSPTLPWKAAYSYAGHTEVNMFDLAPPERSIRLELINVVPNRTARLIVELYRGQFSPPSEFAALRKQRSDLKMEVMVLADLSRWNGLNYLDMYGRII